MVECFAFVAVLLTPAKGAEMLGSASASYRPSDDLGPSDLPCLGGTEAAVHDLRILTDIREVNQ
jgi:hypothetical protein